MQAETKLVREDKESQGGNPREQSKPNADNVGHSNVDTVAEDEVIIPVTRRSSSRVISSSMQASQDLEYGKGDSQFTRPKPRYPTPRRPRDLSVFISTHPRTAMLQLFRHHITSSSQHKHHTQRLSPQYMHPQSISTSESSDSCPKEIRLERVTYQKSFMDFRLQLQQHATRILIIGLAEINGTGVRPFFLQNLSKFEQLGVNAPFESR